MNNIDNNNNVSHSLENTVAILVLMCAFYYKYRMVIQEYWLGFTERLENPFFIVFLVSSFIALCLLYYTVGHHLEKFFNKLNMWRLGIKSDPNQRPISFNYMAFDFQKHIQDFNNNSENKDKTFIGLNAEKRNKEAVSISDIQRCEHIQVIGQTGTGKTTGVFLPLIYQDALKGHPVIIIDAKGETAAINQLYGLLNSIGRGEDFLLFSLVDKKNSCTYNPLFVGESDPQIVIDSFLSNYREDNSFYEETAKNIFTDIFYLFHSLGKPFTTKDIYAYLKDEVCRENIKKLITEENKKGLYYLKELENLFESLSDKHKRWEYVMAGFNNYLKEHSDDILNEADSDIVLTEAIRQKKIVYFQLPTNAYPLQAVNIARIVQANLRYISSLIQMGQLPKDTLVSVIIDEYGSLAETSFAELLNKARSSGMMVTIAMQSLSDLKAISEPFMKRIDESTLNKIYLKQTDPELCELIAKSIGTYVKEDKTYRMTGGRFGNQLFSGESSNRMVNEFYFPPDKIKNLHKRGQGYFVYRGDNSYVCVNLSYFDRMYGIPYEKKSKDNKKEGLELFKRYYLVAPKKKKTPKKSNPSKKKTPKPGDIETGDSPEQKGQV